MNSNKLEPSLRMALRREAEVSQSFNVSIQVSRNPSSREAVHLGNKVSSRPSSSVIDAELDKRHIQDLTDQSWVEFIELVGSARLQRASR